jgi:hypothetical protein
MKKITLLAGLVAVATVLLADLAFAEHSPEHVQAGSDGSAHEDFPQSASGDPCLDPNYPRQTPDGCQASELPDVRTAPSARIRASSDPRSKPRRYHLQLAPLRSISTPRLAFCPRPADHRSSPWVPASCSWVADS